MKILETFKQCFVMFCHTHLFEFKLLLMHLSPLLAHEFLECCDRVSFILIIPTFSIIPGTLKVLKMTEKINYDSIKNTISTFQTGKPISKCSENCLSFHKYVTYPSPLVYSLSQFNVSSLDLKTVNR